MASSKFTNTARTVYTQTLQKKKQCRDENGFKCHTTSESHQRQLLLFADNSGKYIYSFSKEFADGYMELLRRRFGTKRVSANKVYQEYISHKDHLSAYERYALVDTRTLLNGSDDLASVLSTKRRKDGS